MTFTTEDILQYNKLIYLLPYYHYYLYGNCMYILALYPVCLYLLFFKDIKLKKAYMYMLFMCATTTLLNSILYAAWAPVTNQSFMGGFSTGITSNFAINFNVQIFQISLVLLTNSQVSTTLLLVFQYAHLNHKAFLSKIGRTGTRLILTYIIYTLFLLLVSLIFVPLSLNDPMEFKNYVVKTNNTYAQLLLINQPSLITFVAVLNPTVYVLSFIEITSPLFLFGLALYYTVAVSKIITSSRGVVSHNTYKREMMMLRTFIFKSLMMLIFHVIPIVGYTICLWLEYKNPIMGLILNIILVSHGWPSYIGSVWLIKPYRMILLKTMYKVTPFNFVPTTRSILRPSSTFPQRSTGYIDNAILPSA